MDKNIKRKVDKILKRGIKELKKTGKIIPKAYFYVDDNKVYISEMHFSDNSLEKQLAIERIRYVAKEHKAICVLWMADSITSQTKDIYPRFAPDQKEAITIVYEDRNGIFVITQEYVRSFFNKIKLGKRNVFDSKYDSKGVMAASLL